MTQKLVTLVLALLSAGTLTATDLDEEARAIEALLIAPCCFSQQVSVHHSPAAADVRKDIRRRLGAGETREQILAAYMEQYGTRILAEPPASGFNRTLYVLPPLALILTAGLVVRAVRRFTGRRAPAMQPAAAGMARDERYRAELDEQLRDLD